jgi:hypothetical protein
MRRAAKKDSATNYHNNQKPLAINLVGSNKFICKNT